jgi:hypothetical protein
MVESNADDVVTVSSEEEVIDEQRLADFKAKVASKCTTYRNAKSSDNAKKQSVMASLQQDVGAQLDVAAQVANYKSEHQSEALAAAPQTSTIEEESEKK